MLDTRIARELPRAERRVRGVYFTPPALAAWVSAEVLREPLAACARDADGVPRLRVLDPAAGSGRFLVAAVDVLAAAAPGATREAIVRRCVVGVERDPALAEHARAALGPGADIRVGDALLDASAAASGAWDAVVGNPPYVRSVALKRDDPALWARLRGRFIATSHGEWDLYGAFLERTLDWLAPDGARAGLVVPSRWLVGAFAGPLRAHLAARGAVTRVVDYGARQVFEDATTYTSIVFLASQPAAVVELERWAGAVDATGDAPLPGTGPWARGRIAAASLGAAPWHLAAADAAPRLARLRAAGPSLGDIARISKGAGTNADSIFLVDEPGELTVPCLRGRDITAGSRTAQVRKHALLPYAGDRLVDPARMATHFPGATAYLNAHRRELEARERGRFAGDTFYRWGRPQNIAWHLDPAPKLVVPDACRAPRAALDVAGCLVIDTAYAIRPHDPAAVPIGLLLAVLNAPVVEEWLRLTSVPLRGGYFRMKTAFLRSLPVPDPSTPGAREVARLALNPSTPAAELAARTAALYGVGRVASST